MDSQSHQQHQHQTPQTHSDSLYDIIGVPATATIQQITKMFRRRAVKEHPNKGGDPEKFRTLSEAYQILKNPEKKDLYDKYGIEGVKAGGDPNSNGFFNLFQTHSKGPKKCRPKLVQVKITLEDAFVGKQVQKQAIRIRTCKQCLGKGGQNAVNCQPCQGRGMKQLIIMIAPGIPTRRPVPCEICQGMGITFSQQDKCKVCEGKRVVEDTKMFKITIQSGVPHEHDYIIPSQADQIPGFQAGDLYFRIFIQSHQIFTRKGADLYFTKQISLLHALAGITFTQKLLNQEQILISSIQQEIISNNQKKLIKRKGMPFYKSPESRGHLVVTFSIIMPVFQNIQQKKYFRLSHLLKQPIKYSRDVQGVVLQLESYKQPSKIRADEYDDQAQGGVQCQPQ